MNNIPSKELLILRKKIDLLDDQILLKIKNRKQFCFDVKVFEKEIEDLNGKLHNLDEEKEIDKKYLKYTKDIAKMYKQVLKEICEDCEIDEERLVLTDIENISLLNSRIVYLGEKVAQAKINIFPELKKLKNPEKMRSFLINKEREKEVISEMVSKAKELGIYDESTIADFAKTLIKITTNVEIKYILNLK